MKPLSAQWFSDISSVIIEKEIYDELVDREKNLILAIMMNVTHIHMRDKLATLKIEHEFSEPFNEDITARWQSIGKPMQMECFHLRNL